MKVSDIKQMNLEDLKTKIENEQTDLLKLKMSQKVSVLEDPLAIRHTRRNIARMKTILNQKLAEQ